MNFRDMKRKMVLANLIPTEHIEGKTDINSSNQLKSKCLVDQ